MRLPVPADAFPRKRAAPSTRQSGMRFGSTCLKETSTDPRAMMTVVSGGAEKVSGFDRRSGECGAPTGLGRGPASQTQPRRTRWSPRMARTKPPLTESPSKTRPSVPSVCSASRARKIASTSPDAGSRGALPGPRPARSCCGTFGVVGREGGSQRLVDDGSSAARRQRVTPSQLDAEEGDSARWA